MISFSEVLPTTRKSGVYAEFNSTRASRGIFQMPVTGCLVGHRTSAATLLNLRPIKLTSADKAGQYFGIGSMLHNMARAWFANNDQTEVYAIAVAEPAGVAATFTITVTGPATSTGTLAIYVGGRRYAISVVSGDTDSTIATAIAAAITADTLLIATAAAVSAVVTLTLRHIGTCGNDLNVGHSYLEGEVLPTGVGIAVAAGVTGTGDPTISAVFTALGERWINSFVIPFFDATNLTAIETEMTSRQNAYRQIGGYTFCNRNAAYATVQTLGNSRNNFRHSILGSTGLPTPPWEAAAAEAAQISKSVAADPAKPLQTIALLGVMAPPVTSRYSWSEGNSNLFAGVSTFNVDTDGTVRLDRVISTYKTNPAGGADSSWLDVNTGYTLDAIRFDAVSFFKNRYARHKLAQDGTRFGAGQDVLTPKDAFGELVARFGLWEAQGWTQDVELFKRDSLVELDANDASRLNLDLVVRLVGGLRVAALKFSFQL